MGLIYRVSRRLIPTCNSYSFLPAAFFFNSFFFCRPDLLDQALKCVRFFNIMARLPVEVQSLTVRTLFPSLAERQVASRDNFEAALRRFSLMGL